MIRAVLDTNVLVAALTSREGASFRLLDMLGPEGPYLPLVSVPLVLEYEMALRRRRMVERADIDRVLDFLCAIGDQREIYYLWRPFLRDPNDEMVLEVAVGGNADAIVTHNIRDFKRVKEQFGIAVLSPGEFLLRLREEGET